MRAKDTPYHQNNLEEPSPDMRRWDDNPSMNGDMLRPIKTIDSILDELENFVSQNPHSKAVVEARLAGIFSLTAAPSKVAQEATTTGKKLWSEEMKRTKAKGRRNPVQFIQQEYQEELSLGLVTRPILRKLDFKLYQAFSVWVSRNGGVDPLNLPTRSDVVEERATSSEFDTIRVDARRYEADRQKRYRMSR